MKSILLTISIFVLVNAGQETFRAAVYEHQGVNPVEDCQIETCSRDLALISIRANLEVYKAQTKIAKDGGAQIIVFPEFALVGMGLVRETMWPFGEFIPNVDEDFTNPCDDVTEDDNDKLIQRTLSCLAKDNQIYLAANMLDVQPCNECGEDRCMYNTEVIYDTTGKLMAKYHKWNLFDTEIPWFNIDKEPQNVYIDTDFGRLGISICEDLLWSPPTASLVDEFNIDTMVFSTEWWYEFPHQIPHGLWQAYAMGLQMNFLGSNYHDTIFANTGSGIYTTEGVISWYANTSWFSGGKLLISDLPIKPTKFDVNWSKFAKENIDSFSEEGVQFQAEMFGDVFDMIEMDPTNTKVKVCNKKTPELCCMAEYEYDMTEEDGVFSLGVFEGNHTKEGSIKGSMGYSVCTVMKCNSLDPLKCNSWDHAVALQSTTTFKKLEISGNFNEDVRVFPQVWFQNAALSPTLPKVLPDGRFELNLDEFPDDNMPLVTMSLYNRNYKLDGPIPENLCPHKKLSENAAKSAKPKGGQNSQKVEEGCEEQ